MNNIEAFPSPREFELTQPQAEAVRTLHNSRNEGVSGGYIDMATGTGKTLVAAHDIASFLEDNPDSRILVLCHQASILRQDHSTLNSVLKADSHGYLFGGEFGDQQQVVYATFQSMGRKLGGGHVYEAFAENEFDYVLVDESHHGPANTYRPVIEHFKPAFLLGLTATPDRRDQRDLKEIFGSSLYRLSLEEAIAKGHLAKPDYRLMTDRLRDLKDVRSQLGRVSLAKFTKNLFIQKREEEVVDEIIKHVGEIEDPRAVIFCPGIEHAEHFSDILPSNAKTLHSKLSPEQQQQRLDQFRHGEVNTLLVVDQLNEGVDVPEINLMVFLRSTESKTIFLQQLGRGLRMLPGKDSVLILDFAGNWDRIRMVKDLERTVKGHFAQSQHEFRTIKEPFEFNFSDEAYSAIQVIEQARLAKKQEPRPIKRPRIEQHVADEAKVMELLGLKNLPDQSMSQGEYENFGLRIAAGDEAAKQEFILRRLRYVMRIAANYPEENGLTTEDHFQNGLEGLIFAVNSYDPKRHNSFRTHADMASWRFMLARRNLSNLGGTHAVRQQIVLEKIEEKLRKELGREPTMSDVVETETLDRGEVGGIL